MKQIIINKNNLSKEQIDFNVIRVKGLIINSNNEILLAHNNGTYQFPGGHVEKEESLNITLTREIKEETGIDINIEEEPFINIITYDNNYFNTGKKVVNAIYYYVIKTDEEPDYTKTHYDELESATPFDMFYISLKNIKQFITNAINSNHIDPCIGEEMMLVFDEYNNIYGGIN